MLRASILLLTMAGFAACGDGLREVRLANPLVTGTIAANRLVLPQRDLEQEYGFPAGTLDATAELTVLDARQICFAVAMHVEDDDEYRLEMNSWQFAVSLPGAADLTTPRVSAPLERHSSFYRGAMRHSTYVGDETQCREVGHESSLQSQRTGRRPVSWSVHCQGQPVYETTREQTMLRVVSGGATVCFDHDGTVTAGTSTVALRMTDVTDTNTSLGWRWRFTQH